MRNRHGAVSVNKKRITLPRGTVRHRRDGAGLLPPTSSDPISPVGSTRLPCTYRSRIAREPSPHHGATTRGKTTHTARAIAMIHPMVGQVAGWPVDGMLCRTAGPGRVSRAEGLPPGRGIGPSIPPSHRRRSG